MSEYQWYEFVAIDKPLSSQDMRELRALSTRATITATRFWNEYHYGRFKGDPSKLVAKYFDAHLYFANWGTQRLVLRMPYERVDVATLAPYFVGDAAFIERKGEHLVVEFVSEEQDGGGYEVDFDESTLPALLPLRGEIMSGDLRPAYLAWLRTVQAGEVDDDEVEPPVPSGLDALTPAQTALTYLLSIDPDLLAAAVQGSGKPVDDREPFRAWLFARTAAEKDEWLQKAADDLDLPLGQALLRAFRATQPKEEPAKRRTVAELSALVDDARARYEQAEAEKKQRALDEAKAARAKELMALGHDLDKVWWRLDTLVESSKYDDAVKLALDLRELAFITAAMDDFTARFEALRTKYARRTAFRDRWQAALKPRT